LRLACASEEKIVIRKVLVRDKTKGKPSGEKT